jgi:hypothetical protein
MNGLFYRVIILLTLSTALAWGNPPVNHQTENDVYNSDVKRALKICSAVTSESDILGRNIAGRIESEFDGNCPDIISTPYNLSQWTKDISSAVQHLDLNDIWYKTNMIALKKSSKAIWGTHMKIIKDEKLTEDVAVKMICDQAPQLCKNKEYESAVTKAFKEFKKQTDANPIKFITGPDQNKILHTEIKPQIAEANKVCEVVKKRELELQAQSSCTEFDQLNVKQLNPGQCQAKLDRIHQERKELVRMSTPKIKASMEKILGTDLGPLLITKDLREKLGSLDSDFVYANCMKGEGRVFGDIWNKDLLKARSDFRVLTIKELMSIQDKYQRDYSLPKKYESLQSYLKHNPSTIAELLKNDTNSANALGLCSMIKNIHTWDRVSQVADGVIIGVGAIAGIATFWTGIGAPATAALTSVALGASAAQVGKSTLEYFNEIEQSEKTSTAVATNQKKLEDGLVDIKKSEERQDAAISNAATIVVSTVAGLGIAQGVKAYATLKQGKNALIAANFLNTTDEAVAVKSLEKGTKLLKEHVSSLGTKGKILSQLDSGDEAALAALYSNLDVNDATALTAQLSRLDTSDELKLFITNVNKKANELTGTKFDQNELKKIVDASKKKQTPVSIAQTDKLDDTIPHLERVKETLLKKGKILSDEKVKGILRELRTLNCK